MPLRDPSIAKPEALALSGKKACPICTILPQTAINSVTRTR